MVLSCNLPHGVIVSQDHIGIQDASPLDAYIPSGKEEGQAQKDEQRCPGLVYAPQTGIRGTYSPWSFPTRLEVRSNVSPARRVRSEPRGVQDRDRTQWRGGGDRETGHGRCR